MMSKRARKSVKNIDNNELFKELIEKQLKNIDNDKKLQYNDIKRICKYINSSIFDPNKCCIWYGYITNVNNSNKGTYINFYFRKKKAALHRLLYNNFIGELKSNEYLKFNCENKGKCCNIHHLKKYKYQNINQDTSIKKESLIDKKKESKTIEIVNKDVKDEKLLEKLHISFD